MCPASLPDAKRTETAGGDFVGTQCCAGHPVWWHFPTRAAQLPAPSSSPLQVLTVAAPAWHTGASSDTGSSRAWPHLSAEPWEAVTVSREKLSHHQQEQWQQQQHYHPGALCAVNKALLHRTDRGEHRGCLNKRGALIFPLHPDLYSWSSNRRKVWRMKQPLLCPSYYTFV